MMLGDLLRALEWKDLSHLVRYSNSSGQNGGDHGRIGLRTLLDHSFSVLPPHIFFQNLLLLASDRKSVV